MKYIPLFITVLIAYNIVIFNKPHWLLEPKVYLGQNNSLGDPKQLKGTEDETETEESVDRISPGIESSLQTVGSDNDQRSATPVFEINLPSGGNLRPIPADFLLAFAVIILFIELIKTTKIGGSAKIEHVLSAIVLIVFLLEFLFVKECATPTFLIVIMLSLIDVVGGYAITSISSSRVIN